ncbi:MAG: hypothetical protein DMG42_03755 [Acidobacteria bacterium]|nr:MAG: hypothetical protein DMG42_03755 [Acidobacteriota bacterium]
MKHHAWASKQLIVVVALAIAFAPAGKAAESSRRIPLDRTTNGVEHIALLAASSEQISGEPQEATAHPAPQLSPTAVAPPTSKPPQVTYEDGQLTIIAENSALSEVMKALRSALVCDSSFGKRCGRHPECVVNPAQQVHWSADSGVARKRSHATCTHERRAKGGSGF